jgi:threonine dehydrogenase-like Zn-dependent dehydrogenase
VIGNISEIHNSPTLFATRKGVVEVKPRTVPALGKDEVRVETEFSMISPGTELHFVLDNHTRRAQYPCELGYMTVGRIIGIGSEVKGRCIGERVLVLESHGAIRNCSVVRLHPLPEGLDPIEACPSVLLTVALRSIRATQVRLGDSIAVFGLGLIGLYAVHLARLSGAFPVIAVDPVARRRDIAKQLGADYVIDPNQSQPGDEIEKITGGERAIVTIDASGSPHVISKLPAMTATFGRIAVLGGVHGLVEIDLYTHIQKSNQTIVGCGAAMPRDYPHDEYRNVETMLAMIRAGIVRPRPAITHIAPYTRATKMYTALVDNKETTLGVVFDWRHQ